MKVLVTGAAGQLGTDVCAELRNRNIKHIGVDIINGDGNDFLDITDAEAVCAYFTKIKPQCVIHTAAYTAVDKAEDEPELCYKINAEGTKNVAEACQKTGAEMIYISTDYIFGGNENEPYETDAVKNPESVYGRSKLAGEKTVLQHLDRYYIVRISWVFGHNGSNFVKTMQRLAGEVNHPRVLNVVCDQVGSPTYTVDLVILLCDMVLSGKYGEYHATNEGYCSWAEFAAEIMKQSEASCEINPIPTEQYPTKAKRPKNSRLSKACLDRVGFKRLPDWHVALKRYIEQERMNEKE